MRIDGMNPGSAPLSQAAPSNPFHVARAYGLGPVRPVQPAVTTPVQPVAPVRRDEGTGREESRLDVVSRLVAGVVPGGVSFAGDGSGGGGGGGGAAAPAATGALAMYRHPADKNAAATAVNVGRTLDVNG